MIKSKEELPSLYNFQKQDLMKWYKHLDRRAIFDYEPGTGKGFIGARVVRTYASEGKRVLVLTTNNLTLDWIENVEELGVEIKQLKKTTKRERAKSDQISIVSYDLLHKFLSLDFDLIIADEVHKCKSHSSTRSKAFKVMAQKTEDLLMMTGTMWQHRDQEELLNYMWCLNTDEIRKVIPQKITHYRNRYSNMFSPPNSNMRWYTTTKAGAEIVEATIKPYILTRTKAEELELPDYTEKIIKVDSEYKFKEMVKKLEEEMHMSLSDSYEKPHITHSLMLANGMDFETKEIKNDAKIKTTIELLESIPEEKQVIVWYYWKDFGLELEKVISKKHSVGMVRGGFTPEKKVEIVNSFKKGGFRILLASIGTLAEGFNLQNASYAIFTNIWYDYIKFFQATSRINRNGQKEKTTSYLLVGKKTIEEQATKVLQRKMSLEEAKDFLNSTMADKFRKGSVI